jgi:hypothetical protein
VVFEKVARFGRGLSFDTEDFGDHEVGEAHLLIGNLTHVAVETDDDVLDDVAEDFDLSN